MTSIIRPLVGASSSSSSISTPDSDSSDDYPEIGINACGEPTEGGRLILMVAPNGDRSHNNSSRYDTIGRSEVSDAHTLSDGLVWNLNPDFNAILVQAITETIQRMAPDGSPFAVLAQQGVEAVNLIVGEKSVAFLGGNLPFGQGVPEVRLRSQPNSPAVRTWRTTAHLPEPHRVGVRLRSGWPP
jgi:hypothetical protein